MVGILKELGYNEVNTIYYKDLTFGTNALNDNKRTLDITDFCMVHLSVDVYKQHPLSQPEYFEGSLVEEKDLNDENIINLEENICYKFFMMKYLGGIVK